MVLGTLGGIGLVDRTDRTAVAEKWKRDPVLVDPARMGMDVAFIVMLFLTALTGIALLLLRDTAAMGLLLALHLGVVFALFITTALWQVRPRHLSLPRAGALRARAADDAEAWRGGVVERPFFPFSPCGRRWLAFLRAG